LGGGGEHPAEDVLKEGMKERGVVSDDVMGELVLQ